MTTTVINYTDFQLYNGKNNQFLLVDYITSTPISQNATVTFEFQFPSIPQYSSEYCFKIENFMISIDSTDFTIKVADRLYWLTNNKPLLQVNNIDTIYSENGLGIYMNDYDDVNVPGIFANITNNTTASTTISLRVVVEIFHKTRV